MSAPPLRAVPRPAFSTRADALLRIVRSGREILDALEQLALAEGPKAGELGDELTADDAARLVAMDRKTLLRLTRGLPFRRRYSRTNIRFERRGFERWRQSMREAPTR